MKLVTFQLRGDQRIGAFIASENARILDLKAALRPGDAGLARYFSDMVSFIEGGEPCLDLARELLSKPKEQDVLDTASLEILAPIPRPPRLRDFSSFEGHASVAGKLPAQWYRDPCYYYSNAYSVIGTDKEVLWPESSNQIDYELEIAAVIGRKGCNIQVEKAADYIFGLTIFNDLSARDWQMEEMYDLKAPSVGPSRSKHFDGGNVIGPCIVTLDEIPNIYDLKMSATVNGELWSEGNTRTMHHSFEKMIAFASEAQTILPGEIFGSGTVGGGCGLELGKYMKRGDTVELSIERIGTLKTHIK